MASWLLLLLTLLFAIPATAQVAIRDIRIETPRDYGYVIGDRISHRIELQLNDPYRLAADGLPEPGRIDHWLALEPPRVEEQRDVSGIIYRIELDYQLINLDPTMQRLTLPGLRLGISDGRRRFSTLVPEWTFGVAWLSDPAQPASRLQPDLPPPPLVPPGRELTLAGSGLLLALLLLGYRYGRLPLGRRSAFAAALRELKRMSEPPWDKVRQQAALQIVHGAFNQVAGGTLLVGELDRFLSKRPEFAALREPIGAFFALSEILFYQPEPHRASVDKAALIRLCGQCRDAERGLA